ncbi:hypothetical protein D3C76_1570610 [compost metagenome]
MPSPTRLTRAPICSNRCALPGRSTWRRTQYRINVHCSISTSVASSMRGSTVSSSSIRPTSMQAGMMKTCRHGTACSRTRNRLAE